MLNNRQIKSHYLTIYNVKYSNLLQLNLLKRFFFQRKYQKKDKCIKTLKLVRLQLVCTHSPYLKLKKTVAETKKYNNNCVYDCTSNFKVKKYSLLLHSKRVTI